MCQGGLPWCSRAHGASLYSSDHTATLPIGGLSYVHGCTKSRLINKTVGHCLNATAQRFPDREALVIFHENIRLTFAQLKEEVGPDLDSSKWAGASPQAVLAGWTHKSST